MQPHFILPEALTARMNLDALTESGDYWDTLMPSHFANQTKCSMSWRLNWVIRRRDDPLTVLRNLNSDIRRIFEYSPTRRFTIDEL